GSPFCTVANDTVTVAVPLAPPLDAVIVALPATVPLAVKTPLLSMIPSAGWSRLQLGVMLWPSRVALNCTVGGVCPAVICNIALGGVTTIVAPLIGTPPSGVAPGGRFLFAPG